MVPKMDKSASINISLLFSGIEVNIRKCSKKEFKSSFLYGKKTG